MARYIDADGLKRPMCRMGIAHLGEFMLVDVQKVIDAAPTADVAPVVHGQWIDEGDGRCSHCSNCEHIFDLWDYDFCFCPNCGATMDGGAV